jgi:hypothetical protein
MAGALAQAQVNPGTPPPGGKGQFKAAPGPKAAPMQAGPQEGPMHAEPKAGLMHAEPIHAERLRDGGGALREDQGRGFVPQQGHAVGVPNRWERAPGYARSYGMHHERFGRFGENPVTWSPRYRHGFVHGGYGYRRALRYGYAPGPRRYQPRYEEYAPRRAYDVGIDERRPASRFGYRRAPAYSYAPRFSYGYSYRPRVRYAYAETPYAYDLPRETYATGIFPTVSAIGLHSYDYAYTTRVRPIAAYGGATGSYAGGYPIYNRPLAPAYPTPGCDCD